MSIIDLTGRLTLTVPEAGRVAGLGRDAAYAAVERREIPAIRVGRRLIVPTPALLHKLGWPDDLIAEALGIRSDTGGATLPESADDEPGTGSPSADVSVVTLMTTGGHHGDTPPAA